MGNVSVAARTFIALLVVWSAAALLLTFRVGLPGIPGATVLGALVVVSGLHMIVFRRWRSEFGRRWRAIPGMDAGSASVPLWITSGVFFVAFGLLLIWAGLYAPR